MFPGQRVLGPLRQASGYILGPHWLQTLFFKFTGAQESIDLFTTIAGENEAAMRIGTGVIELIGSILLFIPKRTWLGALLAAGTMGGAIMSHLTILGIEHNGDAFFFR